MRPRLLHLGSFETVARNQLGVNCFNEAEAFTPRILHRRRRGRRSGRGFNEAEAFTPRIRSEFGPFSDGGTLASMRPRLLHLGSVAKTKMLDFCREGFNEAEAFTPRIPIVYRETGSGPVTASMRPRLLHLGSNHLSTRP